MEKFFADCINDTQIIFDMIKLIQHVNNSSLYIDACAHGNSGLPGRNSTTITATAEHEVYIYKSVILYLDGLIRRYRVLALTSGGRFYTPLYFEPEVVEL